MNVDHPFKTAYLRFLQLVAAMDQVSELQNLDANEKALFDSICRHWSIGKRLTVRAAIDQTSLGSAATLHKRLHRLITKDLIVAEYDRGDRRTKYLCPSEKGLVYVEWLSSQMTLAQSP